MKRIVAIVLPELACELVRMSFPTKGDPFAVIVDDDEPSGEPVQPSAVLHAVDGRAWQYGARPGQKAAQAAAFVGKLEVVRLSRTRIIEALGAIAEVALSFGTTAGFDLHCDDSRLRDQEATARYPAGAGAGPYDTVWLDVTGCSRLVGGDDLLCAELRERVGQLGHRARVAIADGPRIAQALARWSPASETVVPAGESAAHLAPLPVAALPFSPERLGWLGKLGIFRVTDLALLDKKRLSPRLGREASDLIALLSGRDDVPVVAYERPRCIVELASFDYELEGIEPLLFVVRGLTARAVARLHARGEACSLASIALTLDRSILKLTESADRTESEVDGELLLELELPVPLASERDLLRALHAKLERLVLTAPIVAVRLTLDGLAPQRHHQLAMHEKERDPNALPTLLAELGAWLGSDRVGVLELVDAHRPEARSRLVPCDGLGRPSAAPISALFEAPSEPTRLLPEPIEITPSHGGSSRVTSPLPLRAPSSPVRPGSLVAAGHHLFILDRTRLTHRLDAVDWWSAEPLRRDYLRAWLHGASGTARSSSKPGRPLSNETLRPHTEHVEASLFVVHEPSDDDLHDEGGPRVFLHGWLD